MRVATFNVHFWMDRQGRLTVDQTIDLLRRLRCDAVALQEVPDGYGALARVADELGMHYAYASASWLGNALLSVHRPRSFEVLTISTGFLEERSAFVAVLPWAGGTFQFIGTHLDPHEERTRLQQLEKLLGNLDGNAKGGLRLLAGDFNALRLSDYDDATLERIRAHRASNHREQPLADVTARLETSGFVDLSLLARNSLTAPRGAGPQQPRSCGELATCWAGTRIDYIWAAAGWADHANLIGCEHIATDVSDHLPVVVELVPV